MTGIYIRAFNPNSGKYETVELEEAPKEVRDEWVNSLSPEERSRLLDRFCDVLFEAEERIKALEKIAFWKED